MDGGGGGPSSQPLSRNVAVLQSGCPWKTGGRESSREPCSYLMTPQQQQESKHQHGCLQQQGSTEKTPATAGSVWKSYKSGRKWSQKYSCECGSDKKKFVVVKGPQVAVVFARSGSEGLQGSDNTGEGGSPSPPIHYNASDHWKGWALKLMYKKLPNTHVPVFYMALAI